MKSFNKLVFTCRRIFSRKKVKMLCIGMETSLHAGNAPGTSKAARKFFKAVKPRCDYAKLLISEEATKDAVVRELQKICDSDLAIFFYNGHGGRQKGKENETDGKDEFLGLYDKQLLDNEIWNIISQAKGRIFMIFDCCYSETMFRCVTDPKMVPRAGNPVDLLCWAASPENEVSYMDVNAGGFLTKYIMYNLDCSYTYEEAWKRISKNKILASYQKSRMTYLSKNSDFLHKKLFS